MPTLTARENVALPLILDRVNRKTAFERADDELKILGMADRANHRPSRLSGGQQQRVSIARAMIIKPMLLLGDEPTGALDTRTGTEVAELLRKVASDWHHTVIIVTHNPRIAAYADRIVYLKDGTIVDDNQLDERQPSASEIHQQLSHVVAN
jgi:putative ABC transport system ATP-binding protein